MKVDNSLNEIEFESVGHLGVVLSGLNLLRHKGHLTDVTLKTEDQTFQAHRVVLASCSDYFRAMFTDPMRERKQSDILLAGVSAPGVRFLLDYIYTSKLSLSLANIQEVLSAASHLQVTQVVEACSNYLQSQLDCENCVDVVTIAETYSLDHLRTKVYRFMSENLATFSKLPEFHRLSAGQIEHLLDNDFPVDVPEERVLEILLNWLDVQSTSRMAHAHKLIRKINFHEIHPAHLTSIMGRKMCSHLPKSFLSRIQTLASQEHNSEEASQCDLAPAYLLNSRGMEEAVVKVGGFGPHGVTNQITYFLPSLGRWRHLTSIPHVESSNFGCVVVKNELYVLGGCFNQSLQEEHIHPFGFRFNPRHNKWSTLAPMHRERCRFSATAVGQSIYVMGGCSERFEDMTSEDEIQQTGALCERYDVDEDKWYPVGPFPDGSVRSQHSAVRHHNLIVLSGGLDQDVTLNSILVYNVTTTSWNTQETRSMPLPRADHVMLCWRDRIYFSGGWFEDEVNGSRTLVDSIDVYDVDSNSWVVETKIPTPRFHAGSAIVKDKLYIIGGFLSESLFDRATGLIECYDLVKRTWCANEVYPYELWEHTCASLYIPRCRDNMDVIAYDVKT
ncbi:kelch-like protein 12 isoform X2 [Tigriopus californicus]|nr:kelch-like protein 12 isoform X2 [Tigriopus californicus]XP_059093876.1 kelch-like protein 12 isoform X2 [Tigriopus californicus]